MLTALLTAIAFIVGTFAERIIFAVVTLLLARWISRRIVALKRRLTASWHRFVAAASHRTRTARIILSMIFGPTVWVRAAR